MGEAYAYLVFGKWWTEDSGRTDANGRFETRGFYGEYEITVRHNEQAKTMPVNFFKDSETAFEVRF
jgi:hypothetical protein